MITMSENGACGGGDVYYSRLHYGNINHHVETEEGRTIAKPIGDLEVLQIALT